MMRTEERTLEQLLDQWAARGYFISIVPDFFKRGNIWGWRFLLSYKKGDEWIEDVDMGMDSIENMIAYMDRHLSARVAKAIGGAATKEPVGNPTVPPQSAVPALGHSPKEEQSQVEGNGEGLPVEGEPEPVATLADLQALRVSVWESGYDWGGLESEKDDNGDYVPWYAIEQLLKTK